MALICDTSGVLALYDAGNADHAATAAVVEAETGDLLIPVVLLAEIDYCFMHVSEPTRRATSCMHLLRTNSPSCLWRRQM